MSRGDELFGRRSVEAYLHRPQFELYDLQEDPDELINLIDNPEHAERIDIMKEKMKRYQRQTKDPWIVKWEHE